MFKLLRILVFREMLTVSKILGMESYGIWPFFGSSVKQNRILVLSGLFTVFSLGIACYIVFCSFLML